MPTTDSSAASVRSALRCWTTRESGVTSRAKRHVSSAISGIATAAKSARRTFTLRSTIETPTIIIALEQTCTTPQPMK